MARSSFPNPAIVFQTTRPDSSRIIPVVPIYLGHPSGFISHTLSRLLDEWVVNYPIRLRPKLNVRRFRASDPLWWQDLDATRYGARWGGEVAAEKLTRFLKPETYSLYIQADSEGQNRKRLILENKLRADPNGDIVLLDAFWSFPDTPSFPDVVPPILVYADLMETQDPRNHETAQIIRERYLDHAVS